MRIKAIFLSVALFFITGKTNAQWTVIDPSNLAQNIINVIQASSTASNMIKNLEESVKIYQQGKQYYDALKSVSSIIKDARKVQKTVEMVSEIMEIYVNGFNKMVSDPNFTPNELAAISVGYGKLLEEGAALLSELKIAITSNGLSMSDKDRMDIIDKVYTEMRECRNITKYYTNKNISVSFIRSKEKNDTWRVLDLYGSPSERYW